MAKRRVLHGKNINGRVVGDARNGRSRPVSGDLWESNGHSRARNWRPGGSSAAAPDVPKTKAIPAASKTVGAAVADPPAESSDFLERSEPAGELNPECPACGDAHPRVLFSATDRLYHTTSKVFQIVECKACRLIRLEPRPSKEELIRYYPDQYWFQPDGVAGRLEEMYRRLVLRDHVGFVRQALANSDGAGQIVNVGCGNGLLLSMLPWRNVLGLDFSEKALSVAWKRNGVPGACADLANAPLPHSSCSLITMFHVVEHLPHPVEYLSAARELLTPGGRLVIQVPNASCWQFMFFGDKWNGIDVPRHLFNYRQRDLENLLDFCGFEVMRRKHFSLRDNPAGMATSIAPELDPMARRVRQVREHPAMRLLKDTVYFGMMLASIPFTMIEAACGCGSTIMVEARKKA